MTQNENRQQPPNKSFIDILETLVSTAKKFLTPVEIYEHHSFLRNVYDIVWANAGDDVSVVAVVDFFLQINCRTAGRCLRERLYLCTNTINSILVVTVEHFVQSRLAKHITSTSTCAEMYGAIILECTNAFVDVLKYINEEYKHSHELLATQVISLLLVECGFEPYLWTFALRMLRGIKKDDAFNNDDESSTQHILYCQQVLHAVNIKTANTQTLDLLTSRGAEATPHNLYCLKHIFALKYDQSSFETTRCIDIIRSVPTKVWQETLNVITCMGRPETFGKIAMNRSKKLAKNSFYSYILRMHTSSTTSCQSMQSELSQATDCGADNAGDMGLCMCASYVRAVAVTLRSLEMVCSADRCINNDYIKESIAVHCVFSKFDDGNASLFNPW